jgi:hypothetical protein
MVKVWAGDSQVDTASTVCDQALPATQVAAKASADAENNFVFDIGQLQKA